MKINRKQQKNQELRDALKRHKIGWRDFFRYGYYNVDFMNNITIFGMGKYRGEYNYHVCTLAGINHTLPTGMEA